MTELTPAELARIAEANALAAVVVDENATIRSSANNNSICELLSASPDFGPACAEFCGRALERAGDARAPFRCHAGLDCVAVRLNVDKPLVAIVGRAFTSAENYRRATERAISGDWSKFPPTKFFDNVLLTGAERNIEDAATRIAALGTANERRTPDMTGKATGPGPENAVAEEEPERVQTEVTKREPAVPDTAESDETPIPTADDSVKPAEIADKTRIDELLRGFQEETAELLPIAGPPTAESDELAAWRSFFGSLASLKYQDACESILEFLGRRYGIGSLGWLELRDAGFEVIASTGAFLGHRFRVRLRSDDRRLFQAIESETPLMLRERTSAGEKTGRGSLVLFPIAVGDEIQNALVVADTVADAELFRHLSRFCHSVASEIEVLRLREEVRRRSWLAKAVERFNSGLNDFDSADFWPNLVRISAELMNAERGSLLLLDEKTNRLAVRAAVGVSAEGISQAATGIGERVARSVLNEGRPVVVENVAQTGIGAAPSEWNYRTGSFICYPFVIGNRRIGVLNFADQADGVPYKEADLEVLRSIAPQMAVIIDRAALKEKAGEFEQLSVTDPLTGLLNRRYLEERLAEEIKRSSRYGYPMSLLMIDVDDFGKFNKDFGVLVGDRVLRESVRAMRATLRGADVAARYGGEEFCVLLPQTTLAEARTIAERIRHSVESIDFPERRITVSVGIATYALGITEPDEVIRAADEAMRRAKSSGKNNVQVHESAEFVG